MRRHLSLAACLFGAMTLLVAPLARAQTAPPPYPPPPPGYAQPYPTTPYAQPYQGQPYPGQPYPGQPYGAPYGQYPGTYPPPPVTYTPQVYERPARSGPSAATVAGAVLATTGGLFLVAGFSLWVVSAASAGAADWERNYDLYAHAGDRDASRQRIGLGLLGSGLVLLTVGVVVAVVGRAADRQRFGKLLRTTDLAGGPNAAALRMRF
jgi:hypothetical protein